MRESRSEELRNRLGLRPLQHKTRNRLNRLISRILHSGQKRIVIVEGKTDRMIYWWVRDRFSTGYARVFYAGSISELLKIYDKKATLFEDRNVAAAFMADRDLERLFCTNPEPEDIIWTEGYCIENDLYEGYVKHHLEVLLEPNESKRLEKIRDAVVKWFAFGYEKFQERMLASDTKVGTDLDVLVPQGTTQVDPAFLKDRGFLNPDSDIVDMFKSEYNLRVAGKLLFQMLARFLGDPDRVRKYPGSQTYRLKQIYEMAGKNTSNSKTKRLIEEIEVELTKSEKVISSQKPKSVP